MSDLLLATKIHTPPLQSNLVNRSHLVRRLDDGLNQGRCLTLISAPAGYGKSTLLSAWGSKVGIPVAWLTLDNEDNSPTRFWAYVVAALQCALPEVGETSLAFLRSVDSPPLEVILTSLINEIADQPEQVMLILDDYHLISREAIHAGVGFLIDHLPAQMHLAISTRADPPLPIVRMRARGQLTELRGDDLRFTPDEMRSYLNDQMGLGLFEADMMALDTRLEGWIVGLQLAALSMRDRVDKHEFIVSFTGSHYYILEYLAGEVLDHLPADVLQFLTQTSILTQLSASLCDHVTERSDSAALLSRLYRENLFVTVLDYEHTWYRYHRLFADLLDNRLQQQLDKQAIAELHRRASTWYEEQGILQVAVRHAQAAGDMERVADLAEQTAQASLLDSWMTDLLAWLETLPENVLRSRLRLRIYQACALFFDGQNEQCLRILTASKQAIQELPPSPEDAALREELSRLIEIVEAFVNMLAISLQGKLKQSSQDILRARRLAEESENIFLIAHALEGLALNQFHQGQLRAAASTSKQLIDLAGGGEQESHPAQPLPIAMAGYLLLANICLDQNKLEAMAKYLTKAYKLCRMSGGAKSLVETYVMKSRLQQAQGDLEGAYQSLAKAERAYHLKASQVTRFRLESQKAKLNVEAGALEEVVDWLAGLERADAGTNSPVAVPIILYEVVQLIRARLYLVQQHPEPALQILEQIQTPAENEGRNRHVIEIYTLKALGLQALNHSQAAFEHIERALSLAEAEDFRRVFLDGIFLDQGFPMQQLLYKAAESGSRRAFARKLLVTFPQAEKDTHKPGDELFESLSQRELEVLELLARGLSNRQIAQQLVISLDTVKTHTSNIYGKVGVNNRTQAVIKGKALGLIK